MRVLFAMDRLFPPQRVGGVESSVHDLASALVLRGHTCAVFCRLRARTLLGARSLLRRVLSAGRPTAENTPVGYQLYRSPMLTRDFPRIVEEFRPDTVVVQAPGGLALARQASQLGLRPIFHLRDVEFPREPLGFEPKAIIANSQFIVHRFREQFNLEAHFVPNIIEMERFRVPEPGTHITFINPTPKKGKELAIRLARQNRHLPFLFVEGWRQPPARRRQLRAELALMKNVSWQPSTRDMRSVYARTRILIVPSQCEEAWGRVVSEAQISGIPCIASRIGGLPEAVGDAGILAQHNDFTEWNVALDNLWNDKTLWNHFSMNARTHVNLQLQSTDVIIQRFLSLCT